MQLQERSAAAVKAAEDSVAEAQQRADNAELAKIELSLRLAELSADRDTDLPEPSPVQQQPRPSEPLDSEPLNSESGARVAAAAELEALQKRCLPSWFALSARDKHEMGITKYHQTWRFCLKMARCQVTFKITLLDVCMFMY